MNIGYCSLCMQKTYVLFISECTNLLVCNFQNDILCCRDSIKGVKHTLAQLHKILYHLSLSYDAFHVRAKEATLALALRLVHLLHHEIREGMLNITGMTLKYYNKRQCWLHKADCYRLYFFLYYGVAVGRVAQSV